MWDFFGKLVDALPVWFLIALIAALCAAAAWVLPRLRRDKNGRVYIYSRSYEHQKKRLKEQAALSGEIRESISQLNSRVKSVECENLKQSFFIANETFPKKERLIAGLKYIYAGGNGPTREGVARICEILKGKE